MATDCAPPPTTSGLTSNFRQPPQPPRLSHPAGGPVPAGRGTVSAPTTPITRSSPLGSASTLLGQQHHLSQFGRHKYTRSPLYVPAVLRPTEKHAKRPTPPTRSSASSIVVDQGSGSSIPTREGDQLWGDSWRQALTGGLCDNSVTRVVGDEWNDEVLGTVTGPPTRNHWKPDASALACQSPSHSPTSSATFTFFRRRHHCRRCGNVFCAAHTPHVVPLDQCARFHPDGSPYRACDACWADFSTWATARASRSSSGDGSTDSNVEGAPAVGGGTGVKPPSLQLGNKPKSVGKTPGHHSQSSMTSSMGFVSSRPQSRPDSSRQDISGPDVAETFQDGSIAGSVPRDWNWSTF